jgi:hypothetical protein
MTDAPTAERKITETGLLVFVFKGQETLLMTEDACYADGWHTGVSWDATWVPGGPWVCRRDTLRTDPEWTAYCDQTVKNNKAHMRGWHDGIIAGAEINPNPWVKQELKALIERQSRKQY